MSNLPPGCSASDIPGNRPEDFEAEAMYDAILNALLPLIPGMEPDDERVEKAVESIAQLMQQHADNAVHDCRVEEGMYLASLGIPDPQAFVERAKELEGENQRLREKAIELHDAVVNKVFDLDLDASIRDAVIQAVREVIPDFPELTPTHNTNDQQLEANRPWYEAGL